MDYKYMVVTSCMTYNHAPYIVEAMNGFTMQETNFPVYYLITDDASTDGEPEVIKQYLADHFQTPYRTEETDDYYLICAVHKTNPNCNFIVFFLKYNHHSIKKPKRPYQTEWTENTKYIAICEGDDYWINPMKLQMQYDYMENNPDCTMCFHNAIKFFVQERKLSLFNDFECDKDLTVHEAIHDWKVPTASTFFRTVYSAPPEWLAKIYSGDYSRILYALSEGNIYGFSNIMSVYRINSEGSSATALMKNKNAFMLRQKIVLLESFNKGTNGKFEDEINGKLQILKKEANFQQLKEQRSAMMILSPLFYSKLFEKIKSLL